jgi:hypothetical protein
MAVAAAGLALFLDVIYFATRGHFAVLADDAPARESGEAEEANQAHHTLRLISNTCARRAKRNRVVSLRILGGK